MTAAKLAISLNPELAAQLKLDACAKGESVSGWIAEAITARLRHEGMAQWIKDYEAEFGEITEEEMAKVDAEWPA
jgi:ribulose-5-phosphate 4-epimerase/fuculose-1-phosphate aldolase